MKAAKTYQIELGYTVYPCRTTGGPRPGIRFHSIGGGQGGVGYYDAEHLLVWYRCKDNEQDPDGTFVFRPDPKRTLRERLRDFCRQAPY